MDYWIKLHSQTAGKDKIARLIQYLSRFLWYYAENRKKWKDEVLKLKILESALSSFRKLLRFGKSIEVLYGTLKTLHISDLSVRALTTVSRIQQSLFLLLDNLVWLIRVGLIQSDPKDYINQSHRFWLAYLIVNLARDIYEIKSAFQSLKHYHRRTPRSPLSFIEWAVPQARPIVLLAEARPDIFWDTAKNLCDILIPLAAMGKIPLSPGAVGVAGTLSSIAGIASLLNPLFKLAPS